MGSEMCIRDSPSTSLLPSIFKYFLKGLTAVTAVFCVGLVYSGYGHESLAELTEVPGTGGYGPLAELTEVPGRYTNVARTRTRIRVLS